MLNYQWLLNDSPDIKETEELSEVLNVPNQIAQLLLSRGVTNFDAARDFFRPSLKDLHDPFLMEDMNTAVELLTESLSQRHKIMVYGDYDVDGSTSVAMMYSFLKEFSSNVIFYQPDRYLEGYGISKKGIDFAKEVEVSLIIALDCGTKAIEYIQLARTYGIDVIVCDHHTPGSSLPNANAILNPKKSTCNYPYKELCGCGIGFKLIQAFLIHQGHSVDDAMGYLDYVVVAIGADIVPLTGENRILAYYGLKQVNSNPRMGIRKLLGQINKSVVTISDLVFTVAPRINAAGRIEHANSAVEMLLVDDEQQAENWVQLINAFNNERRELDQAITDEALRMVAEDEFYASSYSTVVWNDGWHKGVVGIVASRLIESHYKPTIVLAVNGGEATGSARSVKGFDVLEAIQQCEDLLTKYGGHKYAAGLSLSVDKLEEFRDRFENVVKNTINDEHLIPKIRIDMEITGEDLVPETPGNPFPKLFRLSEQFGPFGPHNMRPVFLMRNLTDSGYSKIVGEKHLKVTLKCPNTNQIFSGIAFGMAEKLDLLKEGQVDIVFCLSINEYRGSQEIQFDIKDIRASSKA